MPSGWIRGQATENRYPCVPSRRINATSSAYRWTWSQATAPELPSLIRPGSAQNVSQMLAPRPPTSTPPSIWYDAVLVPKRKPGGSWGYGMPAFCPRPWSRR